MRFLYSNRSKSFYIPPARSLRLGSEACANCQQPRARSAEKRAKERVRAALSNPNQFGAPVLSTAAAHPERGRCRVGTCSETLRQARSRIEFAPRAAPSDMSCLEFDGSLPSDQPHHRNVFIQTRPMYALAVPQQFVICALHRRCMGKTWEPGQGNGKPAAILRQGNPQLVVGARDRHGAWRNFKNQRIHSMAHRSLFIEYAGIVTQAAVNPASIVNTLPIADAAPAEHSHNTPDAISSAVL